MQQPTPKFTKNVPRNVVVNKLSPVALCLEKVLDENQHLRDQLKLLTGKQHQEMSRAIQLRENNTTLQTKIYEAKAELARLKDLNYRLRYTKLYRNAA